MVWRKRICQHTQTSWETLSMHLKWFWIIRELYILYDNTVKAKNGQYHIWLYVARVSYFGQFGVDVPMWLLYNFQEMLFWVHTFKNCDKNWGSPGLFRSYSAKCKKQSQLRKIVNTTRRYVLRKKFLTLSLCWIFSFVDTCRSYWEHISRSFCWTEMINRLCWS